MSQPAREYPLPMSPDDAVSLATLVERARAGDGAAFAALFERYNALQEYAEPCECPCGECPCDCGCGCGCC